MKKKVKKLSLNRETLRNLDLRKAVGAGPFPTHALRCNSDPCGPPGGGGTDTYGLCNTLNVCSAECQTGGTACTATDTCASCDPICNP